MNDSRTISIFDSVSDSRMQSYQSSVDHLQNILSSYGLTANQSKVYIYLGKYGSKTAPQVCRTLNLPRTETYHLLTALQNKGIVEATFEHPTQFNALPLDKTIWTLVNTQKERVKDLEREEKNI
ncbi:MAG: TrmB family transcriptional regulator, partial [Thaumarchaeota archaeon]|nr:TrmB family transcriptional regulator [Nitrososphaerota archaeon]